MSEATEKKAEAKAPEKPAEKRPDPFRRQAALALLSGYVQRNGGFGATPESQGIVMRQVWDFADAFVAAETAGPLPQAVPYDPLNLPAAPERQYKERPVAPNDEWGVVVGDRRARNFVTRAEAQEYADRHPGARVVQIAGPEIDARMAKAS